MVPITKNNTGPTTGTNDRIIHINLSTGDSNSDFKIITTVISHNKGMPIGIIRLKIVARMLGSLYSRVISYSLFDQDADYKRIKRKVVIFFMGRIFLVLVQLLIISVS